MSDALLCDLDAPIPFVPTDRALAALVRPRPAGPKTFLEAAATAVISARAAYEDSKQSAGRCRGKKGKKKESGDAYFLGLVAGLLEARLIFHRCNEARPTARTTGAGMLNRGN